MTPFKPAASTGAAARAEMAETAIIGHTIRYQRPDTPYSLGRMLVRTEHDTAKQVARLEALGYTIVEVCPPDTKEIAR